MTTIKLPESLRYLGDIVFYNCIALESIDIPEGITDIKSSSFYGCKSLKTIKLPSSLQSIAGNSFYGCNVLEEIVIPDGVTEIGTETFYGCTNLMNVTLPSNLTIISNGCFQLCSSLSNIHIPEKITTIGDKAFRSSGLVSIDMPNSITTIGKESFANCHSLKEVTISNSIINIPESAFSDCNSLNDITIPNSVVSIGRNGFKGITSQSVVMSDNLTTLNNSAFQQSTIGTLRISPNLASAGSSAFHEANVEKVVYITDNPIEPINTGGTFKNHGKVLYANKSAQEKYMQVSPWKQFPSIIWCEVHIPETLEFSEQESRIKTISATPPQDFPFGPFTVSWSSSNTSIASVESKLDEDGNPTFDANVVARKEGICTLTATAVSATGDVLTSACEVTVTGLGEGIELDIIEKTLVMPTDLTVQLSATTKPAVIDSPMIWSSSNPDVATVSDNGLVTAIAPGEANIFVSTTINGVEYSDKCKIYINKLVSEITLSASTIELSPVEFELPSEAELSATLAPADANHRNLIWSTSDPQIASIEPDKTTQKVKVISHNCGKAIITATTTDGSNLSATCEVIVKKLVDGVTIDKESSTIYFGGTEAQASVALKPTVSPKDATDATLTWTSSNPEVASVDENGNVVALSKGTAVITASANGGTNKSATCAVTVEQLVTEVKIDKQLNLYLGGKPEQQTGQLSPEITPDNANDKSLTWTSSAPAIASVDADGKVTALKTGTATIKATSNDKGKKAASCTVTVAHLIEEMQIKKSGVAVETVDLTLGNMTSNAVAYLTAAVNNTATNKAVAWTSSDPSVATINSDGMMMGLRKGTATITATAKDISGISASCTVRVSQLPLHIGINQPAVTLTLGGEPSMATATLVATVTPATANDPSAAWSSSNPAVASVDADGNVSGLKEGTAIITARTSNGLTASCTVTVTELPKNISLSAYSGTLHLGGGKADSSMRIEATVDCDHADQPEHKTITWSTSDPATATVDSEGNVTAHAAGTADITASTSFGLVAACNVTVLQRPTDIHLDRSSASLVKGDSNEDNAITLHAFLAPSGIADGFMTDDVVTWASSNPYVVQVSEGRLLPMQPGDAIVTASANGLTASCEVSVVNSETPVTGVTIIPENSRLTLGADSKDAITLLKAIVTPADATYKSVKWQSSNPEVAAINEDGVLVACKAGGVTVTATTTNGLTASCNVEVTQLPTQVMLSVPAVTLTPDAKSRESAMAISATVSPDDADDKSLTWSSSNPGVASVDDKGYVTALSDGVAIITATTHNGVEATCEVTVRQLPASVALSASSGVLTLGGEESKKSMTLTATVDCGHPEHQDVEWTSSDESVAVVNASGKVFAIGAGTASITAMTVNGLSASCDVTVEQLATGVFLNTDRLMLTLGSMPEEATSTLTAAVTPFDTRDKKIAWSSSDENVAVVNSDGTVVATGAGEATISASILGMTAKTAVTVKQQPTALDLDRTVLPLILGGDEGARSAQLAALAYPLLSDSRLTWRSSDEEVALVNSEGKVYARGAGAATITATAENGVSVDCEVTVVQMVTNIEIASDATTTLVLGSQKTSVATLEALVFPLDATNPNVVWSSSDENVASVNRYGYVGGRKPGTAIITATTTDGSNLSASIEIDVIRNARSISLDRQEAEMHPGETITLSAEYNPSDSNTVDLDWSSSDESVAMVFGGTVVALRAGEAVITARAADGSGLSAECKVTVLEGTGVNALQEEGISVMAANGAIVVRNAPLGEDIHIFDTKGLEVAGVTATSSEEVIPMATPDVYIVMTGGKSVRIACR